MNKFSNHKQWGPFTEKEFCLFPQCWTSGSRFS